ncbi:hypothetical protein ACR76M_14330 [Enterococcus innesii]|uniref:hypothetical protein n=1 Tax=Enterococcus TaxID=1350 RepID=UPI001A96FF73|nr:hypothetical protein [Enterococcus casseliflavus]MBO1145957.1 hypothetical protein [Enterococcus casseliflavus]MBV6372325.1 hypothetical protein [Enterococcus casseliflavus]
MKRLIKSWLDTTILRGTVWDTIVQIIFSFIIIFFSFFYNIWLYIEIVIPYLQKKELFSLVNLFFYMEELFAIYLLIGCFSILLVASLRRYLLPTNNEKYESYVYENATENTQINWKIHREIQKQNMGLFYSLYVFFIGIVKLTVYPILWPFAYAFILFKKGFYL